MLHDLVSLLYLCQGFDWDEGNRDKNRKKHGVTMIEAEQVFFNRPLVISEDQEHSQEEERYAAYGRTNLDRLLFIVFTVRHRKIRIISARDQDKQERKLYEQAQKAA